MTDPSDGADGDVFRSAFEGAFDAMVIADDEGRYVEANGAACDLFGLPREELIGRHVEEFLPEGVDFEDAWRGFLAAEHERDTIRLVRPDGEERIVEYASTADVAPGRHLAVLRDVTDRDVRERELERMEDRYRRLVEQNMVGIYLIRDREFEYVNPRLAEIFRERPEDMIGRSPLEWIVEEDHGRVRKNLQRRERGEVDSLNFTVAGRRSNGERFDFEVHGGRVDIEGGVGVLGVLRDVTEREEYERRLERQKERLDEFASVVTHDLRSPLNVATGHLEIAREECDSPALDRVERAHGRMEELIEEVLSLAREGRIIRELEPVSLSGIVDAARSSTGLDASNLTVEGALGTVRADEERLRTLLENLFRNAMEHAGPDPSVGVGALDGGFYVEDDGPGIPPEGREGAFDPEYGGVGLGIVRRIAEAHGWEIEATEGESGGARFEITGVEFV